MDFIRGLPKSHGVDVICVVVDRLSKYAHFLPLKHPYTAHSVAEKFVKEIVRLHGFPVSIISDRDRVFLSSFWRECFKLAGTKLKFSTAYHPQTYRQTELVNRCLESYLRCFTSSHPKQWSQFLSWAEFWYNSSFHTCLKATPFELVYGRKPPSLIRFEEGSASNFELESMLKERDAMLEDIKIHLSRAQDLMKNNADKHRRDLQLEVGSLVFLKLRPYRQKSVSKRFCQKLAAKFYGPFKVIERVGAVAYRLELPASCKIHPVFHISQLKPVLGKDHEVIPLPESLTDAEELVLFPEELLDSRYDADGFLEVLVSWRELPHFEKTWMKLSELEQNFPTFELEGKLNFGEGGIDRPRRCYMRKKNRRRVENIEQEEINDVEVAGNTVGVC